MTTHRNSRSRKLVMDLTEGNPPLPPPPTAASRPNPLQDIYWPTPTNVLYDTSLTTSDEMSSDVGSPPASTCRASMSRAKNKNNTSEHFSSTRLGGKPSTAFVKRVQEKLKRKKPKIPGKKPKAVAVENGKSYKTRWDYDIKEKELTKEVSNKIHMFVNFL